MQPALQNDATWKCLLFLLIVARAQNLAGSICSKHRPLPRLHKLRVVLDSRRFVLSVWRRAMSVRVLFVVLLCKASSISRDLYALRTKCSGFRGPGCTCFREIRGFGAHRAMREAGLRM